MKSIKKGDIVARKSYGKDILFIVNNIVTINRKRVAILRGRFERIVADSEVEDLEIVSKELINEKIQEFESKITKKVSKGQNYKIAILTPNTRAKEKIISGKILHLDGDKKYSEKAYKYYQRMGLDAIVKNIPEYKQPIVVYRLLKIYNPDILVITGHERGY